MFRSSYAERYHNVLSSSSEHVMDAEYSNALRRSNRRLRVVVIVLSLLCAVLAIASLANGAVKSSDPVEDLGCLAHTR